jgi:hypothetical protein
MNDRKTPDGKPILTDPDAESADPALPALLARPKGAPLYHGFPLIEETRTDGGCYGAITAFEDPAGCGGGDGFVVAPDGSRAGRVWSVGAFPTKVYSGPEPERWGVYYIAFPRAIRTVDDLVGCFRAVLPELKALYAKVHSHQAGRGERQGNAQA